VQVRFDEIPAEGREFEINDSSWFPTAGVTPVGTTQARVRLERRRDRVFLEGMLAGRIRLTCDRCLAEYECSLDHEFKLDLELSTAPEGEATEHDCHDSEMDVMFLPAPLVDLGEILAQQVFLTLPAKRLCREECQGLCPRCGINLNNERCDCNGVAGSPSFARLKELKH